METGIYIKRGNVGPDVEDIRQRLLRTNPSGGLPEPDRAEVFDRELEQQVRSFQRARGIAADGIVGSETWRQLVEAGYQLGDRLLWRTRNMMRGDDVVALQHRINLLGFDAGSEDGIFGPLTQTAVEEFQRNIGLVVDGVVGPSTLATLSRVQRDYQFGGVGIAAREREALRRLSGRGVIGARVLIDPTRGRDDPGAIGPTGVAQFEICWSIANRLAARLQASGAVVDLSRGPRTTPTAAQRAGLANELAVDVVISIGLSALASPVARGASTYYFGTERFVSAGGQRLAEIVQDAVTVGGWRPDCRTHMSTAPILRDTRMPAVIVEPGFLTSPLDERKLRSGTWQDRLVDALATAVTAFFSEQAPVVTGLPGAPVLA